MLYGRDSVVTPFFVTCQKGCGHEFMPLLSIKLSESKPT